MKKQAIQVLLAGVFVFGGWAVSLGGRLASASPELNYEESVREITTVLNDLEVRQRLGGFKVNGVESLQSAGHYRVCAGYCCVEVAVKMIPELPVVPPALSVSVVKHNCGPRD
jgi:hypothetical protein